MVLAIGILAALLLALALPVEVAFRVQGVTAFSARVAVRWLFGLVRWRITLPAEARPPKRSARDAKPGRRGAKGDARSGGGALAALRQAAFRRRLVRFGKDLVRAAHVHEFDLRMRLGLDDPADTGRLWAIVWPASVAALRASHARVDIEPDFTEAVLDFDARGRLRLIPVQFIALAVAFALSPPSIRAWRTMQAGHA